MNFVGSVRIPNNELAILRGRDEVATVSSPVHGVDLRKVTLERAARLHHDAGERVNLCSHSANYLMSRVGGGQRGAAM